MSIQDLERRLLDKVASYDQPARLNQIFIEPYRLKKTLIAIEQKFDALENTEPLNEKIFRALSKLESSGFEALSRRDWKNVAWSLNKQHDGSSEKVLFSFIGNKISV